MKLCWAMAMTTKRMHTCAQLTSDMVTKMESRGNRYGNKNEMIIFVSWSLHLVGKTLLEQKNPIINRIGDIVCSPDKLSYACFGQSRHKFSIHSKESNNNTLCCGEKVQMKNEVYQCVGYKTSGSWLKGDSGEQCILVSDSCGYISKYEVHKKNATVA
jgi:hypothetical protein